MLKLRKIAITGGLAAGKTTVCQFFEDLGAYVVSADAVVHQLLSPNTNVGQRVIALLGPDVLKGNAIDRKKVSDKVFSHPDKLQTLEQIIHPAVFDAIENEYQQVKKEGKYPLFVAEIPLLYEAKIPLAFDAVISVTADAVLCKKRFLQEHSEGEFEARMQRQLGQDVKNKCADYVLQNNGTLKELKEKVKQLFKKL
jgi:dephospho-CoA kinase